MDDESDLTAYHESGHAVMASFLGGRVERLTIAPENDDGPERLGDARVVWLRHSLTERELAVREIKVSLAGPVAELIYNGDQYDAEFLAEWRSDWEIAVQRAATFLPATCLMEYLGRMALELIQFFERDDVWATVAALADELAAHETLGQEQIAEVLHTWRIG